MDVCNFKTAHKGISATMRIDVVTMYSPGSCGNPLPLLGGLRIPGRKEDCMAHEASKGTPEDLLYSQALRQGFVILK